MVGQGDEMIEERGGCVDGMEMQGRWLAVRWEASLGGVEARCDGDEDGFIEVGGRKGGEGRSWLGMRGSVGRKDGWQVLMGGVTR